MKVTSSLATAGSKKNTPLVSRIVQRFVPVRFGARLVLGLAAVFLVAAVIFVPSSAQRDERAVQTPVLETAVEMYDKYAPQPTKDGLPQVEEVEPGTSNELITATTYAFLVGSSSINDMSSGTTQLIGPNVDDTASAVTNIGFDFWYDGVRYTQFSCNANGVCRLGPTAVGTTFTNSLGSTTNAPKIAPYFDDLWVGTNGKVHYKVINVAPNRELVVEWLNMQIPRVGSGNAGAGTFQMTLTESAAPVIPGAIRFFYGTGVVVNSANSGYSIGIQSGAATNFASITSATDSVSYAVATDTQTTAITAEKVYGFNSNVPAAPTGLNFTAVTPTSMTVNWTDVATNEVGYVIYRSTDGVNYTFLTQTAADAVLFADSGLNPSTPYFYQVRAVTEGALSPALSGSQMTAAPGNITSAASGNWDAPATWGGSVPTAGDNVTIAAGHTVTINSSNALSVTVQSGGVLQFEDVTARTLTVGQFVTIDSGGIFQTAATGTQTGHILSVGTDLTNNGTLDFSTNANTAGAGITFTGAANNTFGGTGATTDVRAITINKGTSNANVLELTASNFTVQGVNTDVAGYLTLTNGTFKISGTFTMANRTFPGPTYLIAATGGIWLNNPNYTVAATVSGSTTANSGLFRVSQGTYNIGVGVGDQMRGNTNAVFTIEGTGVVNVSGAFDPQSSVTYTQTGGTMNVGVVGNNVSNFGTFELFGTATVFTMSGGTINVINPCTGATKVDVRINAPLANQNITGGMIVIGATGAPASSTYNVVALLPSVTINPTMTMAVNGAAVFMRGSTVINNGAITSIGASPRFDFGSQNSAMSYSGSGVFGTLATVFAGVGVSANSTFLTTLSSPIVCNRVNLFQGGFIGSGNITLGNAGASTTVVQIGSTGLTTPGGNFDVSPVHNQGTGGEILLYAFETAPRTTGFEINPTRILTSINLIDNINTVTIAGGDLTLSATGAAIVLTNGRFITGANNLILSSGTATVTRTNGYVDGNFRKTFAAAANKTFEVGTANGYAPVGVNVTAGTFPATFTVNSVQGPQPNIPTPSLALSRYWKLTEGGDVTADLTFNYLDPTDIPVTATEADFVIQKYNGAFSQPGGTVTPATNQATISGVTDFSDWTLAAPGALLAPGVLQFSAPTYTIGEEGVQASISVTRTGGTDGIVSVDYATVAGGDATGGAACGVGIDYVNTSGTLMLPDGSPGDSFNIPLCGDLIDEVDETVNLQLSNPTGGATLGTQTTAVLTLTDDDVPTSIGPVTVTATAGTPGPTDYPTLKDAFDAINLGTHQGAITASIVADTTETVSAVLLAGDIAPAAYTSVLIQPVGGPRTVSGSIVGAIIRLNGADNVTIDGRIAGVGRNLSVINGSSATATAAIWLSSVAAGNGASNNVIRNLEISCGADEQASANSTFGIIQSGTTISTTSANGNDNDNNQFIFNRVVRVRYGIVSRGVTTNNNLNAVVADNIIGPAAFGPDQIGKAGIYMQADTGATVTRNLIQNVGVLIGNAAGGSDRIGIGIGGENWSVTDSTTITSGDYTVTRNTIQNIIEEKTFSAVGIKLGTTRSGVATNNLVANNFIMNVRSNGTVGDQFVGIGISGGNGDRVVFNSISITGDVDPAGAAASSTWGGAIRIPGANAANNANFTLMDNSIYLDVNSNTATQHYFAITLNSAAYVFGTGGLNYNNYYINAANPQLRTGGLGVATTTGPGTEFLDLAAWKLALTTVQDANSIQVNPLHFSPTGDLHIPTNSPNVDVGLTIAGIVDDIDAQARPNGANPDIGADEAYASPGTLQFSSATYNVSETGGFATITITRAGGANGAASVDYSTVAGGSAVGGAACAPGIDYVNTSGTKNWADLDGTPQSFTVAICSDGVLEAPETVNLALTNATGATLGTPNTSVLTIADGGSTFSGPYNVGTGEISTSLTNPGGIFDAINNGVVAGNVTINITSDLTGESGAIALNQFASPFTLTIKPSGAARSITGTAANLSLIKLNGADNVTLDGSLSGGADRSLTLTYGNTGGTVIWIASAGAANGATGNTIKNCILSGNVVTPIISGVLAGSGTTLGGAAESPNDNNTLQNNQIFRVQNAAFLSGNATTLDQNWLITGNSFGSSVAADKMIFRGMLLGNAQNFTISNNTITGVSSSTVTSSTMTGIQLASLMNTGTVTGNKISDIKHNNTTGWGSNGIYLTSTSVAANVTIANNFISDVASQGFNGQADTDNGYGITIVAGGGYKIYHNSILLNTNQGAGAATGQTAGINITAGVTTVGAVDLRDNVVASTQTLGTRFGVISNAPATVFSNIDYNDYFAQNVGFIGGSAKATLLDWQTATGQDANSLAVDPLFVTSPAPADLHIQAASPMKNAGATGTGVVVDIDGDTRPSGSAPDVGADEIVEGGSSGVLAFSAPTYSIGEAGVMATITVTRTGGSTGTVGVSYATVAGGTATGGAACGGTVDYVNSSGTLSFPDMNTSQTFDIPICSDALDEADETVNLQLTLPTGGATIGAQSTAVLTITDDDATPSIAIASPSPQQQPETNAGSHTVTFFVSLSAASGQTVTVHYQTNDGSATTANNDYVGIPDTLMTFDPGETSKVVDVTVNGDTTPEPDENFTVDLSTPTNATIGTASASAIIGNDDSADSFSINDVRTQETNSGTHTVTFTVSLFSPGSPPGFASVNYATGGGTATAGAADPADYMSASGTLNFGVSEAIATPEGGSTQTQTFTVTIIGDVNKEPNETFFVTLSNPINGSLGDSQGVCIIFDEDRAYVADYDRDLKTDLSVFRPSDTYWYIRQSTNLVTKYQSFGVATDKIVPGDYDADGVTDLAVYRPSSGTWLIERSSDFGLIAVNWGLNTDLPVQGDYDGDDKTDIAVWRPSNGTWYILRSSDSSVRTFQWGTSGDLVVPGDYDGDGLSDFAVFRPSAGTWFVQPNIDTTPITLNFGASGDIPVSGDFDGDGKTDIALFRPTDGNWYITKSLDGSTLGVHWGQSGDIPVVGDYDADGISDIAVWRSSTGDWYVLNSNDPAPPLAPDAPVPSFGHWGQTGDKPVPAAYVPEQ